MRQGKQFGHSANEKNDVWRRWKAGASLHEIERVFDKPHSSMRGLLPRGGIPPAARRRSLLSLTLAEREGISRGIACGRSFREIARHLNRARSTVSRVVFLFIALTKRGLRICASKVWLEPQSLLGRLSRSSARGITWLTLRGFLRWRDWLGLRVSGAPDMNRNGESTPPALSHAPPMTP
jgi:hypothetical protein